MRLQDLLWGAPRYVANTPWGALWAAGMVATILVAAQGVAALVLSALPTKDDVNSAILLGLVAAQTAAVSLVVLASRLFGGRLCEVLRLSLRDVDFRTLAHAVLLMAAVLIPFNAAVYLLWPSNMWDDLQVFAGLIRSSNWWLAALAIGAGAPLMEELLFRGFLQSALAQSRIGFWPAALLTTLAWALLHWGYSAVGLAEVFLIGVYFSWLLWKTGSLLPALFCHALYNSLLVLVLRFVPLPG